MSFSSCNKAGFCVTTLYPQSMVTTVLFLSNTLDQLYGEKWINKSFLTCFFGGGFYHYGMNTVELNRSSSRLILVFIRLFSSIFL